MTSPLLDFLICRVVVASLSVLIFFCYRFFLCSNIFEVNMSIQRGHTFDNVIWPTFFERMKFIYYNYFSFGPYYLCVRLRAINIKKKFANNDRNALKTFVCYFFVEKNDPLRTDMHHNDMK